MIEVVLAPTARAEPQPPSDCVVQDVFWPLSRHDDHLQHLHARVGQSVIAVVLLVESSDAPSALRQSRALCVRVSRTAPVLAGWTVAHCDLVPHLS